MAFQFTSCTNPSFFIKKELGFKLEHVLQLHDELHKLTLIVNLGILTFIKLLSMGLNLAFAIIHFSKMKNKKQFKLGDEVHV